MPSAKKSDAEKRQADLQKQLDKIKQSRPAEMAEVRNFLSNYFDERSDYIAIMKAFPTSGDNKPK